LALLSTKLRRRLAVAVAILVTATAVFVAGWILPTATGYAAKNACSSVFVSGMDLQRITEQDLAVMPYVSLDVDRTNKTVRATVVGLAGRTAVHRDGLGCALAVDVDPASLRAQAWEPLRSVAPDAEWPEGERVSTPPETEGLDRAALDAAVAEIFTEPNADSLRLTRAVVVVHDGRIVAEQYADGFDKSSPLLGWSMTKSVTNALVGILVGRGALDIMKPAPVSAWANDSRKAITLDQLLRMSSGLHFEEVYGPLTDATRMLFEVDDAAALATRQPLAVDPDTTFSYSSGTSNIVSRIVRDQFDSLSAYHRFPNEALFGPVGMRTAVLETDGSGTFVGSSFMYASARDWARFGLLYLRDGMWGDVRILPEGWAAYSGRATPTAKQGEYAAHFWANAGGKLAHVPRDAYWASGFQGQAVLIVPSRNAVIVRLGLTHDRPSWDLDAFATAVLAALPPPRAP